MVASDSASFGDLLHQFRLSRGYSARALGRLAGLDSTYVGRLERGALHPPKIPTVHRLAQALQLNSVEEIALIEASGRLPDNVAVVPRSQVGPGDELMPSVPPFPPAEAESRLLMPKPVADRMRRAQRACYERILSWITEIYGERAIPRGDARVVDVSYDSYQASILVMPWRADDALIAGIVRVATGITVTGELMWYLLRENATIRFGAFAIDENDGICFQHTIPGSICTKQALKAWVDTVVTTADQYSDQIAARRGSRRTSVPPR